jgi:hypothetical protein
LDYPLYCDFSVTIMALVELLIWEAPEPLVVDYAIWMRLVLLYHSFSMRNEIKVGKWAI